MNTQTVVLDSFPLNLNSTFELWSLSSFTMISSTIATETSYGSGQYTGIFINVTGGTYSIKHRNSNGNVIWTSFVKILEQTGTMIASDTAISVVPPSTGEIALSIGASSGTIDNQLIYIKNQVDTINSQSNQVYIKVSGTQDQITSMEAKVDDIQTKQVELNAALTTQVIYLY